MSSLSLSVVETAASAFVCLPAKAEIGGLRLSEGGISQKRERGKGHGIRSPLSAKGAVFGYKQAGLGPENRPIAAYAIDGSLVTGPGRSRQRAGFPRRRLRRPRPPQGGSALRNRRDRKDLPLRVIRVRRRGGTRSSRWRRRRRRRVGRRSGGAGAGPGTGHRPRLNPGVQRQDRGRNLQRRSRRRRKAGEDADGVPLLKSHI